MGIVDFILNLAVLLLWVKWRSLPFDPIHTRTPATLVGTLRRAEPSHFRRWHLLVAIALLLLGRAGFYRLLGPALHWSGSLDFGVITLWFRSDLFGRNLAFSICSFGLTLGVFYLCLLLLSLLNTKPAEAEPIQRLVRIPLGAIDGWSPWSKIISPFVTASLIWWLASWALAWQEVIPRPVSAAHRIEESLLIGLGSYLAWKYAAVTLLVLRLLNTYIYFGKHPFWNYVNTIALALLAPLRKIPLRAGRADFAPVIGIALVILLAEAAQRGLVYFYSHLPF
jgi:uncharacterized protein YggT (Ycf19 family)